jgi:hypothetical protein
MLSGIEREGGNVIGVHGVTNEATSGVCIQSDHEKERKVMGVPESFEALMTDLVVGGGIH